jgi:triacylglycerol lipase
MRATFWALALACALPLLGCGDSNGTESDAGDPSFTWPKRQTTPLTEAQVSQVGPYAVATYSGGYPDAPGYVGSTIHYPADGDPPYAAVAMISGFLSLRDGLFPWAALLASHGIVTISVDPNSPLDMPPMREIALRDALGTLRSENARADGPLQGKLATDRFGAVGFSMGGGGALLLGEHDADIHALVVLCPWNPSYSYAALRVPTLMFAAQNDQLAGGQAQEFYASVPDSVPKLLWERTGVDHFAIDPAESNGALGRYLLSWFKLYLEEDERYRQFVVAAPPNASDYRTTVTR